MRKYILPMILFVLLLMPTALAAGNVKINDFSANITSGTIPLHTRFTGDVTGDVTTWRWEFYNIGTGATTYSSSNPSTHHNFGKPGVYDVTLKVWGPDGNDTLTKPAYVTATAITAEPATAITAEPATAVTAESNDNDETVVAVSEETKSPGETTVPVSTHMNPNWGSRDKQHYSNGYDEGYNIGLINGYNRGYDLGIKGLKYTGTGRSNFAPKCTTSQNIGYADGYNAGYDMKFLSGYNAGYNIYQQQYLK
jgi:PKD repeat protein